MAFSATPGANGFMFVPVAGLAILIIVAYMWRGAGRTTSWNRGEEAGSSSVIGEAFSSDSCGRTMRCNRIIFAEAAFKMLRVGQAALLVFKNTCQSAHYFSERIGYKFLISKCRGDRDLGLCTASVLACGQAMRSGDSPKKNLFRRRKK